MSTPAERITAYLDARRRFPINTDQLAECKIGAQDWTRLTETDLRAVLADNERMEQQHLANASQMTQVTGELRDHSSEILARSEWLEDEVCREMLRLEAENASLRREHEGLLWLIEETANLAEQAADERDQMRADNERMAADLQRAEAEVAKWVAADSADIAAGSYAGEVERLAEKLARLTAVATPAQLLAAGSATAVSYAETVGRLRQQVAETKAKLAAADLAITDYRGFGPCGRSDAHRTHFWETEYRTVRCLGAKEAQPPAVADGDAGAETGPKVGRDGAERGQDGPEGSKAPSGTTQAATEAPAPPAAPDPNEAGR